MPKNAKNKVHDAVSGVLTENVPLNAANKEVNELSNVHNLEILRSNSVYERSPSVSPIPTYSASPVVAGTLGLGKTATEALTGGAAQQTVAELGVGMGLGFSTEQNNGNNDLLVAIQRSQAAYEQQQKGKRKSRRNRRRNNRKTRRRRH